MQEPGWRIPVSTLSFGQIQWWFCLESIYLTSQILNQWQEERDTDTAEEVVAWAQISLIFFFYFSTLLTFPALGLMENQIWVVSFFSITTLLQGWNRAKLWRKAQIAPAGQIWLIQGAWSLKARGIHQLLQIIHISCSRHTLEEKSSV